MIDQIITRLKSLPSSVLVSMRARIIRHYYDKCVPLLVAGLTDINRPMVRHWITRNNFIVDVIDCAYYSTEYIQRENHPLMEEGTFTEDMLLSIHNEIDEYIEKTKSMITVTPITVVPVIIPEILSFNGIIAEFECVKCPDVWFSKHGCIVLKNRDDFPDFNKFCKDDNDYMCQRCNLDVEWRRYIKEKSKQ